MNQPTARPRSAAELRMMILEKEVETVRQAEAVRELERQKHAAFAQSFLTEHISAEELRMVRQLVTNAVRDGKMEALVYSFPSSLCTDEGRAINNGEPHWPETLRGKALEFYEGYRREAAPVGYRLKAMIISFPDGVPGDVGFFLNWAPEED